MTVTKVTINSQRLVAVPIATGLNTAATHFGSCWIFPIHHHRPGDATPKIATSPGRDPGPNHIYASLDCPSSYAQMAS